MSQLAEILAGPLTPEQIGTIEGRLREVRRDRAHEAWTLWEDVGAYLRAKHRSSTPATYAERESTLIRLVRRFPDCRVEDFEPPVGTERVEEWLEVSLPLRAGDPLDGLGRLLFIAGRKPVTEEEWAEAETAGRWELDAASVSHALGASKRGRGPYYFVDPLDGSQRKCWDNAEFIRLSPKLAELWHLDPMAEGA